MATACPHEKVLEVIRTFIAAEEMSPTVREIATRMNKSNNVIANSLLVLERRGALQMKRINDRRISRGIKLLGAQ